MPFNGSGVYDLPNTTVTPALADTTIDNADFNTLTADLETALTKCYTKTGESVATANLPMGGFKHTGVAASSALTDYARVTEYQNGDHVAADAGGAADVQTLAVAPSIAAYNKYQRFSFVPVADNTGACTLNVSSVGAKDVKLVNGEDPSAGDLDATGISEVIYDGTNFILLNPATVTGQLRPSTKTIAKALTPVDDVVIYPTGSDGGPFIAGTGKAAGYYDDDSVLGYGTRFKPTGGDGSAGWERDDKGAVHSEFYKIIADGSTIDTTGLQELVDANYSNELGKGNIKTDSEVIIRPATTITGAGSSEIIDPSTQSGDIENTRILGFGTGAILSNLITPLSDAYNGRIQLRDFTVQANYLPAPLNDYCYYTRGGQKVNLERMIFAFSKVASLYVAAGVVNNIKDCEARYSQGVGLLLDYAADGFAASYNAYMTNIIGGSYNQNADANIKLGVSTVNVNIIGVDCESADNFYAGDGFGVYMSGEANSVLVQGSWFESNNVHIVVGDNSTSTPSPETIPRNVLITSNEFWVINGTASIILNTGIDTVIESNRFFDPDSKIIIGHYSDNPIIRNNSGNVAVEDGNGNEVIIDNKSKVNNFPYSIISAWGLTNCTVTQSFEISPAGAVPVYKVTPTATGAVQLQSTVTTYPWLHNRQSISCYVKTDAAAPIDFYLAVSSVNIPRVYTSNTNDISSIGTDWSIHRIGRSIDSADIGNQAFTIQFTAATTDPIYITGMVSIDGLVYDDYKAPNDLIGTLVGATPSAYGLRYGATFGATTITDILNGQLNQTLTILSDHAVTITDGTNIFLSGSANFVMKATDTLTLIFRADGNWYETARSVN